MTDQELRDLVANLATSQVTREVLQAKTDAQLAKTDTQLAKTDAQLAKTDAQLAKTDAKLNRIAEMVGGISNNQGDIAEAFFYNAISRNPVLQGVTYDYTDKNITRRRDGLEDEFDLVLINGKDVAIIETKYKAHLKDVEKVTTKKRVNFKKLYPEYSGYTHHFGIASFHISDSVKSAALEKGLFVLERSGDVFETFG